MAVAMLYRPGYKLSGNQFVSLYQEPIPATRQVVEDQVEVD